MFVSVCVNAQCVAMRVSLFAHPRLSFSVVRGESFFICSVRLNRCVAVWIYSFICCSVLLRLLLDRCWLQRSHFERRTRS